MAATRSAKTRRTHKGVHLSDTTKGVLYMTGTFLVILAMFASMYLNELNGA